MNKLCPRQPQMARGTKCNQEESVFFPLTMTYAPSGMYETPSCTTTADYRPGLNMHYSSSKNPDSGVGTSKDSHITNYSPSYLNSGSNPSSPKEHNVSPRFTANVLGEHTTDYCTHSHSSNSQTNMNSPWPRFDNNGQIERGKRTQPNITINPGNQNNLSATSSKTQVIIKQPTSVSSRSTADLQKDWSTGLCQCCDGSNTCTAICCCLPCFECWLADKLQEGCCMPWCVPNAVMALRMKVRYKNNIKGSILGDFCASLWCCPCVMCQMKRELDFMESQQSVSTSNVM